jgi:DNA adenine methylase
MRSSVGKLPFLKWAGGKTQLLRQFAPFIPSHDRYYEPFVGGGAMFFHLQPPFAVLADSNPHLINCYAMVRDQPRALVALLEQLRAEHGESHYYDMRARYNASDVEPLERAALFIYLNKTGYNGLYRENARGLFNVPYGRYRQPAIFDETALLEASRLLRHARLMVAPFDKSVGEAGRGDFVYFDPPYQPLSRTSRFTSYTRDAFGEDDQARLAATYRKLHRRGCLLMLSNSDAPLVRELYRDFTVHEVRALRAINCQASGRGAVNELVIVNYEVDPRQIKTAAFQQPSLRMRSIGRSELTRP